MNNTICITCKKIKDEPLKYTRCEKCGNWRLMTESELLRVAKRER